MPPVVLTEPVLGPHRKWVRRGYVLPMTGLTGV